MEVSNSEHPRGHTRAVDGRGDEIGSESSTELTQAAEIEVTEGADASIGRDGANDSGEGTQTANATSSELAGGGRSGVAVGSSSTGGSDATVAQSPSIPQGDHGEVGSGAQQAVHTHTTEGVSSEDTGHALHTDETLGGKRTAEEGVDEGEGIDGGKGAKRAHTAKVIETAGGESSAGGDTGNMVCLGFCVFSMCSVFVCVYV